MPDSALSPELAAESFCYLTTTGRVTATPHEIEIWFAARARTLYLLSERGEQADWVKNLRANAVVRVRLGSVSYSATARVLTLGTAEDALARRLIPEKYEGWHEGDPQVPWVRDALAVALDLNPDQHRHLDADAPECR